MDFTDLPVLSRYLRFTEAGEATHELKTFMQKQVAERKDDIRSQGTAALGAFSMLVEASENEEAKYKLDDSELVRVMTTLTVSYTPADQFWVDWKRVYYAIRRPWCVSRIPKAKLLLHCICCRDYCTLLR